MPISSTPGHIPASPASTAGSTSGAADVPRDQPRHGDVAGVVVQRREQPAQPGQRVGDGAAEHARVHRMREHPHLDGEVDQPAQARGERRDVHGGVGRVGDDDDVGAEQVDVLGEQRGQGRRADLLLALDEQHDADRRPTVEGPQHREVHQHAGLVVGGAASVEAAVALGRRRTAALVQSSTGPVGCTSRCA